ncbi:MAG: inorganic diphosphatase [Chitinophagaceae bacterium]|nr:inorganic diphosphatase [Chitinophagaceae bacterium]
MKLPPAFAAKKNVVNVIIESPRGSRNKYDYEPESGLFKLKKILPTGLFFPLHFGFIPHTINGDGDPVDALVMMDMPTYPGNWIECRAIGLIEAEQTEKNGQVVRNDRLLSVPDCAKDLAHIQSIKDVNPSMLDELVKFFMFYNEMAGKKFRMLRLAGTEAAMLLVQKTIVAS